MTDGKRNERDQRGFGTEWSDSFKDHVNRINAKYERNATLSVRSNTGNTYPTKGDFTVGTYRVTDKPSLNDPGVFSMNAARLADEIVSTIVRKQEDYGPNNIRRSPFGPLQGLTVRLYDKIARLANLSQGRKPQNESLRDTFIDIAGYGIIGLMILDETFPKEQ